ncbi:antibiotic biosynthesis monooxygenase [Actibacterium sp. 188UL27-1]|nr:antibiotic biosynthesis monooxygenase [Actibacterium sp. 188UL27-1]
MFAVTVVFQMSPENLEQFMPLMIENARASVETEDGCHQFDVCTDPSRPGDVFLYELYEDAAAFEAHRQTAHYKTFDGAVGSLVLEKSVRTYSTVAQ